MSNNEARVALYVDDFLPYTHSWIYRQIIDPITNVELVICKNRLEATVFPFKTCVVSKDESFIRKYIRGRFWSLFKYQSPKLNIRNKKDFKKALINHKINIVHAHFGTNGTIIASVCKELNIPLIITFHGHDISSALKRWPGYHTALLKVFEQLKFAIAISQEMADRLKKLGCPEEKIKVSYLGVPLEDFTYYDRSTRIQPIRFLHAARLTSKKGVPDLVRSFAKAFPIAGTAVLDIAGDGEEKELIINTIKKVNPSNPVNLLGRLNYPELILALHKADVFVANSRTDLAGTTEGLPIAILEASSTGLPIISTVHAGIPESVEDKVTGRLIKEFDNEALKNAMVEMLEKPLRLKLGAQARKYMEEKFNLHVCNKILKDIYFKCLN